MKPTESAPEVSGQEDMRGDPGNVTTARDWAMGGLFGALGITVPIVFHAVGMGKAFLPMYLPIFALGLLCSWPVALVVGLVTPILSAVLTGMPPLAPPIAVIMSIELGAGATVTSLCRRLGWGIFPSLLAGLVASRAIGVAGLVTIGRLLGYDEPVYAYAVLSLATSWPGFVLLLSVVPGAVYAIETASILGPSHRQSRGENGPSTPRP